MRLFGANEVTFKLEPDPPPAPPRPPARCVWGPGDAGEKTYRYRYELDFPGAREVPRIRRAVFLMLNPSTAHEAKPDPTVNRCIRFAESWGFDGMGVINLFAIRSTDPNLLYSAPDPVGPENDAQIIDAVRDAEILICAWGNHGAFRGRDKHVLELVSPLTLPFALRTNANGTPAHPLYLPGDTLPVIYCEPMWRR